MTEDNAQMIIEKLNSIDGRLDSLDASINERIDSLDITLNKKIDSLDATINNRIDLLEVTFNERADSLEVSFNERVDSLEDAMNDKFVLLEAKFINRLEKEIGNFAGAIAKGFAGQDKKIDDLHYDIENKMNIGFASVDHRISSLQEFYSSKSAYRFA
jgi:predicted transcriptional regulator